MVLASDTQENVYFSAKMQGEVDILVKKSFKTTVIVTYLLSGTLSHLNINYILIFYHLGVAKYQGMLMNYRLF